MALSPTVALIADSSNLVDRLVPLLRAGALTPERLEAVATRLSSHLADLRELVEIEEGEIAPLPLVSMRFHGRLGVIDGGRS